MEAKQLDRIFAALADSTRRGILARLASGGASVSELAEPFHMSQPAISKHLKVLEEANLISSQIDGQRRPRELNPEPLIQAMDWIERYREVWEMNYSRLDSLLEEIKNPSSKRKPVRKHKSKKL
jgi:DNA-binding transcriptional ArsR family regulator